MKKITMGLALIFSSTVVLAGEVGAQNPQLVDTAKPIWDVAIAETGTSTRWAEVPFNTNERGTVSAHQIAELKSSIDALNQSMNASLEAAIEEKLLDSLKY